MPAGKQGVTCVKRRWSCQGCGATWYQAMTPLACPRCLRRNKPRPEEVRGTETMLTAIQLPPNVSWVQPANGTFPVYSRNGWNKGIRGFSECGVPERTADDLWVTEEVP